jgi:hypothetical protein
METAAARLAKLMALRQMLTGDRIFMCTVFWRNTLSARHFIVNNRDIFFHLMLIKILIVIMLSIHAPWVIFYKIGFGHLFDILKLFGLVIISHCHS